MGATLGFSGCRLRHTPARTSFQRRSLASPPSGGSAQLATASSAGWGARPKPYRSAVQHRAPAIVGAILGIATAAVYLIGANRSYGYDAAATFANFVATPSVWDAFAIHSVLPTVPIKSVASNDHVLLSFLSHVIYSMSGSRSEIVYRLLPALAAGATVGVTTTVLNLRFGLVAGISAGLFIATDPLFVENSRDLRGYSLAALGAVVATVILAGRWTRWRLVAYALLIGLAIAAQFFAVVVLLMHVAWIVARGSWPQVRRLLPAWIVAAAIGVAANANIQVMEPVFSVVVLLMHVAWIVARGSWPQVRRLLPAWIVAAAIGVAANANIQVME